MASPYNLNLISLSVSAGELIPPLSDGRTAFAVHLPHSVSCLEIVAEAREPKAILRVNGQPGATKTISTSLTLAPGRNAVHITVTAPDDTTQTYSVNVVRAYPTVNWERVLEHGPFPERDSAGELVFNDQLWLLGGYLPQLTDDVWKSSDGVHWEQAASVGTPNGVNIPIHFVHNGRMWVSSNTGELFASEDGNSWELVNASPPWAKRYAAGCAAFDGKMWVLGGQLGSELFNDVWCSEDGVTWTQVTEHAGWSPRQLFSNVVVKDGKIWVIGGGITKYQPFRAYQDVWCSEDGVNWENVTKHAPWPARIWSSCVVYHNRIFLLGGFRSQPTWQNFGDLWYSSDGKDWHALETESCWSARHETSAYVLHGKLWVVAGNPWPLFNDVWSLEIPGLTFLTQPVIEEYAGSLYIYRARAEFNRSLAPIRYRLKTAPPWLIIDEVTGVVSGVPPVGQCGEYEVELEAFDSQGETAQQTYTLFVQPL